MGLDDEFNAQGPGLRSSPFHVIRWLGYETLENNPLVRMLHEHRALTTAPRQKAKPERRRFTITGRRVYARGANELSEPEAAAQAASAEGEVTGEPTPVEPITERERERPTEPT